MVYIPYKRMSILPVFDMYHFDIALQVIVRFRHVLKYIKRLQYTGKYFIRGNFNFDVLPLYEPPYAPLQLQHRLRSISLQKYLHSLYVGVKLIFLLIFLYYIISCLFSHVYIPLFGPGMIFLKLFCKSSIIM